MNDSLGELETTLTELEGITNNLAILREAFLDNKNKELREFINNEFEKETKVSPDHSLIMKVQ